MKEIEKEWTQGPTHKLLDASRFEITYRYRQNEWDEWTTVAIGSTARTRETALEKTIGFLSKRQPTWTVQLVRCIDRGDEVEINTGKPVKLVSDNDFKSIKENADAAWEEHEKKEVELQAKNKMQA